MIFGRAYEWPAKGRRKEIQSILLMLNVKKRKGEFLER
jgi:hypothetical protein